MTRSRRQVPTDALGDTESPRKDRSTDQRLAAVPYLTIAYHPDLKRVGECRELVELMAPGGRVGLSRLEPDFFLPGDPAGMPLALKSLSRTPIWLRSDAPGRLVLDPGGSSSGVRAGGSAIREPVELAPAELLGGVVLGLGADLLLLLHTRSPLAVAPAPTPELVGHSQAIERLRAEIPRAAASGGPVLIRGETGVGKEVVAQAIHRASARAGRPLLSINMGAIQADLAMSQLFGHAQAAFSGAARAHDGFFERADGGTLFLDEIGETSLETQAALLRVLETGEVQRLGASKLRMVDVRVLAATDVDLEAAVESGAFRAALYHRLSTYEISVPPLRERPDDIPRLFVHFLRQVLDAAGRSELLDAGREPPWVPVETVEPLLGFAWPGNARQLRNLTQRLATTCLDAPRAIWDPGILARLHGHAEGGPVVSGAALIGAARRAPSQIGESALLEALEQHEWRVGATAAHFGIARNSVYALMDRLNIRTAKEIGDAELREAWEASHHDLGACAAGLRVARKSLLTRLKDLGLDPG